MKYLFFGFCFFLILQSYSQFDSNKLRFEVKHDIRSGHYQDAISRLESNLSYLQNDTMGLFDALLNLYIFTKEWNPLIIASQMHTFKAGEDTSMLSIASFFANEPAERILLSGPVKIPFKRIISGSPLIEVVINGRLYRFIFDTGAGMSVLSSETAWECDIKTKQNTNGFATAATGKAVGFSPGIIDSLQIGGLKVYNHSCIVIDSKDLEFKILGIQILKIDGIIGWNLMQELDVTVDNDNKEIILDKAGELSDTPVNYFWMGLPLIICSDSTSDSLLFFMDTGANQSGLYTPYLNNCDTTQLYKKSMMIGSAGGFKNIKSFIFPEVRLNVGGHNLVMENIGVYPELMKGLFPCMGILGFNEFKGDVLHFNIKQGFFKVSGSE
jgi:hypothetical protein